jgi:dolichol-phosphate mannosyltransferase
MKISVVTPIYKAQDCLEELYERLVKVLPQISDSFEIIFVNDASPDRSWDKIKKIYSRDKRVVGINFSRNFGQHRAITAGLDYSRGDLVVVMDCDLQDRPEDIIKLYQTLNSGHDVVFGQRNQRIDPFIKRISSRIFYLIYNYFTDSSFDSSVANFSISRRVVVENFRKLKEQSRSFPLFIKWMGFKIGFVKVTHSKRFAGKSSYTFNKLINLAIDSIVSQSNKPLKLSIKLGFALSALSVAAALALTLAHFFLNARVEGWTSVIVSIFFLSGLLLANMGIIGLYIGKIFDETKNRPLYVISEMVGRKAG